mmetsp:Transcript_7500/g.19530  ORF Transcript_7500/g.19530 Transcript_7500/m.19530 type:complete len:165 (+) Transcript_7500:103-597(+)
MPPREVVEKFPKYAWDQTAKSVTIYIPCQGASAMSPDDVHHVFGERSFEVRVRLSPTMYHELKIPNLCKPIDPEKSKLTLKADRIQLKLVKVEVDEWSALDDEVDRKKADRAERVASGDLANASTQELLADMYANATDEERASLRAAAASGAQKREEKAKQGVM